MYWQRTITHLLLVIVSLTLAVSTLILRSNGDDAIAVKDTKVSDSSLTAITTSDKTLPNNGDATVADSEEKDGDDSILILETDIEDEDLKELASSTDGLVQKQYKLDTSSPGGLLYLKALNLLEDIPIRPETSIPMHRRRRGGSATGSSLPRQLEIVWRWLPETVFSFMYNFSDEVKDASYNGDKSSTQENSGRTPERRTIPRVEEAIQLLTEAGTKYQHPDALFLLGELYFHGLYAKERNFTSALDYYEQLADLNGNATAQQRTGFIYSIGLGQTVADPRKALLYTTFAGVGGDTVAEMTLGYRYLYGLGVPKSCEESVYYYQRVADKAIDYYESGPPGGRRLPRPRIRLADEEGGVFGIKPAGQSTNGVELDEVIEFYRLEAEKGNLQAKLILGQLYQRGSNRIKQDYRRAIRYYRSVALQVYSSNGKQKKTKNVDEHVAYLAAQAAAFIGEMFWRGEGVKANTATAIRWFKHAIEYNDPVAYNALGVMYRDGNGVRKDLKLAIEYFQKAASKEYDEAQVNMGKIMYASKSYADARYFFMAAAGNGNILAQYYLADMHWEGQGTSYSCPLAVAYYKTVAEKGDWQYSPIPAGYQAYKRGDYETALLVYLQAAEMGYEVAQTNAAWLIDNQRHGHLNMTPSYGQLALSLWMRAANQGNTDARIKSGDYYYNGIGTPQDPKQAAKCYHSVARNDVSDLAMWNLGWMHEHGIGVTKDFYLADRWYKRALEINPNAYFPVVFSRIKLYIHWAWDWLTNLEFLNWSSSSTGDSTHKHKTGKSTGQEGLDGLDDEEDGLMNDDDDEDDIFSEKLAWEEPDDLVDIEDELINGWDWRRGADLPDEYNDQDEEYMGGADDGFRAHDTAKRARQRTSRRNSRGDDNSDDDNEDDAWMDNLVILAMCILVGWMVYVRQFRMDIAHGPMGAVPLAGGHHRHEVRLGGGGGGGRAREAAVQPTPAVDNQHVPVVDNAANHRRRQEQQQEHNITASTSSTSTSNEEEEKEEEKVSLSTDSVNINQQQSESIHLDSNVYASTSHHDEHPSSIIDEHDAMVLKSNSDTNNNNNVESPSDH